MEVNHKDVIEAITLLRHRDPEKYDDILVLVIRELTDAYCEEFTKEKNE